MAIRHWMNSALRSINRRNFVTVPRHICTALQVVAVLLIALSSVLHAQQTTGAIVGKVVDTAGLAIPNATITITNQAKLTGLNLKSDGEGNYSSPPLETGVYTIEVESTNFRPEVQKDFELTDNARAEINFTLKPGSTTEVVEVQANAPMLNSFNAELGTVIDNKTAEALPLNGNNALSMVQMNPGVVSGASPVNEGFNDRGVGVSNIRIGSGLPGSNANLLDGASNLQTTRSDILINSTTAGVQSTRVQYGVISAEYGFTSGGIITMDTKAGTSQLHGQIYESYRNAIFNARNHFQLKGTTPIQIYNQYGAAVGGAIKKDKLFFFTNYEGYNLKQATPQNYYVPTLLERTGVFTEQLGTEQLQVLVGTNKTPETVTVPTGQIFNPDPNGNGVWTGTRPQFTTPNVIDPSLMDQAAVVFMNNFIPKPNIPNAAYGSANYSDNDPLISYQRIGLARIDWQLTNRTSLFARYAYYENATNNQGGYGYLMGVASTRNDDMRNQSAIIGITQILSGTKLNDIRIAVGRSYLPYAAGSAGQNWVTKLGLANVPNSTLPGIGINASFGVNYAISTSTNIGIRTSTVPEINDTLSILHGHHSMHLGLGYRFYEALNNYNTSPSGSFSFNSAVTGQNGTTSFTTPAGNALVSLPSGNAFASFLLGKVASESSIVTADSTVRSYSISGFIQDDWRATSTLILNLGLRYDYQCIPWEKHNGFSTLRLNMVNPQNGLMGREVYAGVNGQGRNFAKENYYDIGPRIGFAWLISQKHKTVLRGGYALYYAASYNSLYMNATDGFGTNTTSYAAQTTAGFIGQLSAGFPYAPLGLPGANGGPSMLLGQSPTVQPVNAPTSASQQFVLAVDHEFVKNTVLSILVTQNHGTHFPMTALNLNQLNPIYFPLGATPPPPGCSQTTTSFLACTTRNPYSGDNIKGSLGATTMSEYQALKPYPYFSTVYDYLPHIGRYLGRNAQVLLRRPITSGLQMQLGYNYGKFMSDPLNAAISVGATLSTTIQNNYQPHSEYSVDPTDVTHNLTGNLTYQLPFGKRKQFFGSASDYLDRWIGNWMLAGTVLAQSGRPLSITGAGTATNSANRPSFVPGQSLTVAHPSASKWFNTAAFESCPVLNGGNLYCFGNVPRTLSQLRGPGTLNINLNLMKMFKYKRYTGEFQVSGFNVINKTNLGTPNSSYTATATTVTAANVASFGQINSAQQPRSLQFTGRLRF